MNREQKILEKTYKARLTVYGWESFIDPDTQESKEREIIKYDNVKCALSKASNKAPETGEFLADMDTEYVIFANPDVVMNANDTAIVTTEQGQIYKGSTGQTFSYASHGETVLKIERKA